MTTASPPNRTTLEHASRGHDEQFSLALTNEIITAILNASIVTDAPVAALRTAETAEALIHCLITVCSFSPHFDTPSHLRTFTDDLAKRVRRQVARNRAKPSPELERFFGFRKEGNA